MTAPILGGSLPLQAITPMYLYQKYSDDDNLQAFVASFNAIAQNYLDWFSGSSDILGLGVYTSSLMTGPLLDWLAKSVYGIARPQLSLASAGGGAYDTVPWDTTAWGTQNITYQGINDDFYKRVLTWYLYRGDGRQASVMWLRRRVARFLYGVNGSDIDVGLTQNINITMVSGAVTITIPNVYASTALRDLTLRNLLPLPFQLTYTVNIL